MKENEISGFCRYLIKNGRIDGIAVIGFRCIVLHLNACERCRDLNTFQVFCILCANVKICDAFGENQVFNGCVIAEISVSG